MTNQQFLDNFYLLLNKVRTFQGPGYEPEEISLFGNKAQEMLVVTKYSPNSNILKEGFEETEKRIQDLGELVKDRKLTPLALSPDNMPNGRFFELPNTLLDDPEDYSDVFWFTVFEQAITDVTECGNIKRVNIYEINHNEYTQLLRDPFNRPSKERVWRMRIDSRRQELITDGTYNITSYHIRYIKKPQPIDLTLSGTLPVSELADHMHRELLDKTLELVLGDTENIQRIRIQNAERKE